MVKVLVAVNVMDSAALAVLYEKRIRRIKAVIAAHTYRDANTGAGMGIARLRSPLLIG
jgi:hypothetical protein